MEVTIAIASIVQAVTAVIIAIATVKYTRVTTKIFESQIQPGLTVEISGLVEKPELEIHNDSGCSVENITVFVTVGIKEDGKANGVRRCVFTRELPSLKVGAIFQEQVVLDLEFGDESRRDKMTICDWEMEYSFVRVADRRRFSFRAPVATAKSGDTVFVFTRTAEPVASLKKLIVKKIVGDAQV